MTDDKKGPSKVDDIARLRMQRYMTKGAGAKQPRKVDTSDIPESGEEFFKATKLRPSIDVLRSEVAKVVKKTNAKKSIRKKRRKRR